MTRAIHSFTDGSLVRLDTGDPSVVSVSAAPNAQPPGRVTPERTSGEHCVLGFRQRLSRFETCRVRVTRSPLVLEAQQTAARLLADDPLRLRHVAGAARVAADVTIGADHVDAVLLVSAAWLHDIGRAHSLVRTGFHPLDGALHLARDGWPDPVVRLVAHHSHARLVAPYYGVQAHLAVIDPLDDEWADVLAYADVAAGRDGRGSTVAARIADMRRNARSGSPVPFEVREQRYLLLEQSAERVMSRMRPLGRTRP